VESFLRVLLGRHDDEVRALFCLYNPPSCENQQTWEVSIGRMWVRMQVPRSKRLLTDAGSNVLIFLTGHGGEEFLKFHDAQELLSRDLADAVAQMHMKSRFNEMLIIADTCKAASMFNDVRSSTSRPSRLSPRTHWRTG